MLNPDKCKELRISFSQNPEAFDSVSIDDKEIEVVTSAKLLGITISDNLTWNTHMNELVKKTNKKTILSCTAETGPTTSPLDELQQSLQSFEDKANNRTP